MYICVCVIPLLYCTFSWQILMPQPILIAPRGPHRFIPSGEGASPSPFGPLNAGVRVRAPLWRPPMASPPATTSKTKIKGSVCHAFFSEISRPCAPYIRLRLRVFF